MRISFHVRRRARASPPCQVPGRFAAHQLWRNPRIARRYAMHALHEGRPVHVAIHHSAKSLLQIRRRQLIVLRDHDSPAACCFHQHPQPRQVCAHRRRKQHHGARERRDCVVKSIQVRTLGNDSHVFVHGQHLRSACPKYRLRIRQDDLVHNVRLVCRIPGNLFTSPPGSCLYQICTAVRLHPGFQFRSFGHIGKSEKSFRLPAIATLPKLLPRPSLCGAKPARFSIRLL